MKIYGVTLNNKDSNYQFPLLEKETDLEFDKKIYNNKIDQLGNIKLTYSGKLDEDILVVSPAFYLCNKKTKNELSKIKGFAFENVDLIEQKSNKINKDYYFFHPEKIISNLIDEDLSTFTIMGEGKPYEFKSWWEIVIDKKKLANIGDEIFKIREKIPTIYVTEKVKNILEKKSKIFEFFEVEVN